MAKRKALGKGLGAFFPDYDESGEGDKERDKQEQTSTYLDPEQRVNVVLEIPIENIRPNPHQPRKEFDEERLEELADSIKRHGLIQPITVRYIGEKRFELISGERRLRATKMAGLDNIAAYIREVEDDDIIAFALVENIQREELNPIEVAMGYQRLIDECGYTQREVARKMGKNRSTITNMLRLLNLPAPIQKALRDRKISMGHARALINVEDDNEQEKILQKTIDKDWSVRQVEKAVRSLSKPKENTSSSTASQQPSTKEKAIYRDITNRLRNKLSTKVDIKPKKNGGEIRIEYYSDEELDRLLSKFETIS